MGCPSGCCDFAKWTTRPNAVAARNRSSTATPWPATSTALIPKPGRRWVSCSAEIVSAMARDTRAPGIAAIGLGSARSAAACNSAVP